MVINIGVDGWLLLTCVCVCHIAHIQYIRIQTQRHSHWQYYEPIVGIRSSGSEGGGEGEGGEGEWMVVLEGLYTLLG